MASHWRSLEEVYVRAASERPAALAGQALARSRRYEELVQILEARCREIEGLRERVTSEAMNLERTLAGYEESLAAHGTEATEKDKDLDAHRAMAEELRIDLENHRSELARVQKDFKITEAALIEERKTREGVSEELAAVHADREAAIHALEGERDVLLDALATEKEQHAAVATQLKQTRDETDRLFLDLQNQLLQVERINSRVDELEQREARLQDEKEARDCTIQELTAYSTQLRRENRLALPLVLPARLLIAIKDRLSGKSSPSNTDRKPE